MLAFEKTLARRSVLLSMRMATMASAMRMAPAMLMRIRIRSELNGRVPLTARVHVAVGCSHLLHTGKYCLGVALRAGSHSRRPCRYCTSWF